MHKTYTLTPDELKSLQNILLEMLIEIDGICKRHKIRYGIDGGSLLGAVRHKGFIPWDDDLDIVLTRPEYERLRETCIAELDPQKYFYQDHTTDPHYTWGYARIRRKNSEFVRLGQEHLKMQTGIFLDIFPRDNVPDNPIFQPLHSAYCWFWRKVLYSETGKISAKSAITRITYRTLNTISAETAFNKLEKLAKRCGRKKTRLMRCYTFPIPQRGIFGYKREWFEEFAEYEFESLYFPGAKDADGYLTCDYGDYMQMPPPEKRRWHPCSSFKLPEDSI